jgi:hypothetical protein
MLNGAERISQNGPAERLYSWALQWVGIGDIGVSIMVISLRGLFQTTTLTSSSISAPDVYGCWIAAIRWIDCVSRT